MKGQGGTLVGARLRRGCRRLLQERAGIRARSFRHTRLPLPMPTRSASPPPRRPAPRRPPPLAKYPHLVSDPAISEGAPIVRGTRTTVRALAEYHQRLGMSADDILMALPHLRAAEVHAGLAYYFDHQAEVDAEIKAENDFEGLRELSGGLLRRFEPAARPRSGS